MPNRIIKEGIRTSRDINNLSDFQFRVWTYLITYVDDYGRGSADPELLKGLVFPRRKGVTEKQISEALSVLANTGMISLYEVDGEPYFYFPAWEKHQQIRAKKSKFPAPDETCTPLQSLDIKCKQPISNVPVIQSNPIQSETNPNTNTEKAHSRFIPPTVDEVRDYCRERHNKVNPERFVSWYEANGWKVGKNPMKNWKAAVRTWEDDSDYKDGQPKKSKYEVLENLSAAEDKDFRRRYADVIVNGVPLGDIWSDKKTPK